MNNEMLHDVVNELIGVYGNDAVSIILYGSEARQTATPDSDIDIAVLITSDNAKHFEDALLDAVVNLNLKYDRVFSVIDIPASNFYAWSDALPFYKNINGDGVVLWKAA